MSYENSPHPLSESGHIGPETTAALSDGRQSLWSTLANRLGITSPHLAGVIQDSDTVTAWPQSLTVKHSKYVTQVGMRQLQAAVEERAAYARRHGLEGSEYGSSLEITTRPIGSHQTESILFSPDQKPVITFLDD